MAVLEVDGPEYTGLKVFDFSAKQFLGSDVVGVNELTSVTCSTCELLTGPIL